MIAGLELDVFIAEKIMGDDPHKDPYCYSTSNIYIVILLEKLRKITESCVLLEASRNPEEFLCTIGWHHRGQWFKDLQVSAETAPLAVCLAAEKWLEEGK